jgi:type I restriction enzyme, S subunit
MVTDVKGIREEYKVTELGEIPEEWSIKKLANIGEFKKGKGIAKKDLTDEGNPCILYGELYTKYKETIGHVHSKTSVCKSKSVIGKNNDVLIPSSGETAFDIACASSLLTGDVLIGGDVNIFTPNPDVSGAFLSYLLNSVRKNDLAKLAQGSSVYHLYSSTLSGFLVMLPTLEEQQKIAEILSTVDETVETTDQLLEKTKELKKGLMQQLLTKGIGHTEFKKTELGEIPEEWGISALGDLVHKIVGGGTPSRKKLEYYSGDIPWFTVKDMDGSFYKDSSQEYVNEIAIKESSANLVEPNQVIIATRIALGRGFISTVPVAINQDLKALYLDEDKVLADYFLYWFLSQAERIEGLGSGSTVKGIRLEQLRGINLPVPNLLEQKKIVSILSSIDEQIKIYREEKERLQELKKGLMQQLLTGKIRVTV